MGCSTSKPQVQKFICLNCNKLYQAKMLPIVYSQHKCSIAIIKAPNNSQSFSYFPRIINKQVTPRQQIMVKTAKDSSVTQFVWKKQQQVDFSNATKVMEGAPAALVKKLSFQQKYAWFYYHLSKSKIPWNVDVQRIIVDRSNLIHSSKEKFLKIDLHKQLKILFNDEKGQDDAGGILKEWMHQAIKEIFSPDVGIFSLCNTKQTAYKFKIQEQLDQEYAVDFIRFLGKIIGKAILQKIPINCRLNYLILRKITGNPIHFHDFYSYDRQIYNGYKLFLDETGVQNLDQNFTLREKLGGSFKQVSLVQNGTQKKVTDANKQQFVRECLKVYSQQFVSGYIKTLKQGIHNVVPENLLQVFEPHQLQMIISGPATIDVKSWKQNTIYEGYDKNHKVIDWFWSTLENLKQQQLSNFLHYCTGTNRVPIKGFQFLQGNRGNILRFTIRKVNYQSLNPYPKSQTCFNRLLLPEYSNKQQLAQRMLTIVQKELPGFDGI